MIIKLFASNPQYLQNTKTSLHLVLLNRNKLKMSHSSHDKVMTVLFSYKANLHNI